MGQYYKMIIVREKNNNKTILKFNSWDHDNGAKLMEHSYYTNSYVETVAMQLYKKPGHVAWVGDYANNYIQELREEGKFDLAKKYEPYEAIERDETIKSTKLKQDPRKNCLGLVIYNHDKKEYVDLFDFFCNNNYIDGDWSTCIHPLPLLTAIGNGQGGGDYYSGYPDADKVGIWAGDLIEIAPYNKKYFVDLKYTNITRTLHWKEQKTDPNDTTK